MSAAAYFADDEPVSRERFYALACDPARSIVVEACAGAGKTWMLVSRILRALLAGALPQQIVAITFTRKAAGEMRGRLGEWLSEFARLDPQKQCAELRARGLSEPEATSLQPRLTTLHQELLRGGRGVEVRTFHGWFSQLLRAAPLTLLERLGLAPELRLMEEELEAALMPTLWRRFHAAVLADPVLLADYRGLSIARGRFNLRSWLLAAFAKRMELRLAEEAGTLAGSLPGPGYDPQAQFEALRPQLLALAHWLGQGGAKAQQAATALEQARDFEATWAALFTQKDEPRKQLGSSPQLDDAWEALTEIKAAFEQQAAAAEHAALRRLALVLIEAFEGLKQERGLIDNNDLERGALALLADPELSGWVQQRLDARVAHLLIDEFQDTSPLQWQALQGWLAAYAGAGGGRAAVSVFIVGDPKQSIYRFRRAEPRVFAAARQFVGEALGGVALACDHTRRNAPDVIRAANGLFTGLLPGYRAHTTEVQGQDELAGLWSLDGPAAEKSAAERDPLRWRPSLTEPRHEPEFERRAPECERVTACIAGLLASRPGLKPKDVFVLARKREPLRQLSRALTRAGIPHAAPETEPLVEQVDVQDLLAVLDVLASPGHDLSLARALRSPLFGVDEADLMVLAETAGSVIWLGQDARDARERRPWWDALQDLAAPPPALARAQALLRAWAAAAPLSTPHALLDRIVHEGEVPARLAAAVPPADAAPRLQAVQALLRAALELDSGRYATLYGFVRAMRQRSPAFAPSGVENAVQLLTIHGAKGLEAEVVILLDGDAAPPRAETYGLLLDWPVDAPAPRRAAFLASESKPPASLASLVEDERQAREREELNALYVAVTRARRALIISRTPAGRASAMPSWWSRLAPRAQPWALGVSPAAPGVLPGLTRRPLPGWVGQAQFRPADAAERPAAARVGEALHRALEWVSQPGQSWPLEALLDASAQAFGLDAKGREQLAASCRAILASPACRQFFDPVALRWAGNEVPVALPDGSEGRIDRLVQALDGVWWVLDYKLGLTPEAVAAYGEQLRGYVAAVQSLQPGEPVKAALISGDGRFIPVG